MSDIKKEEKCTLDIKKEEKSDFPEWAYDMAKESAMGMDDSFLLIQEWHDTHRDN